MSIAELHPRAFGEMLSICITSTVPDRLNANAAIRSFAERGFKAAFPHWSVYSCPMSEAPGVIATYHPSLTLAIGGLAIDTVDLGPIVRSARQSASILMFWLHDDPYEFDYAFKVHDVGDVILTNESGCVSSYQRRHVFHMPLAGDPETHFRDVLSEENKDIDVFFCGVAYQNRVDILRSIADVLAECNTVILGDGWPSDLRFARNRRLSASEYADYAARSLITLNIGRTHNLANRRLDLPATTPGPRTFEVALAGSAQIIISSDLSIEDFFDTNREILYADSPGVLRALIGTMLRRPARLRELALAAQTAALDRHTYKRRAEQIFQIFLNVTGSGLPRE